MKKTYFIEWISISFIFLSLGFCSFVLISRKQIRDRRQNQKIKAARKWLKSLLACLKEKNSPDFSFLSLRAEKIGIRQFFFFNGNPNGFFNAISMMPEKRPLTSTRKLKESTSFFHSCESCLMTTTQNNKTRKKGSKPT